MDSFVFGSKPGAWEWPDELRERHPGTAGSERSASATSTSPAPDTAQESPDRRGAEPEPQPAPEAARRRRHYKPRTCRICLETVLPTYHPPAADDIQLPGIFQPSSPAVTYTSADGGRLLSPCRCKGTQKYVHEGCLQRWRHADRGYARPRNYYECPTCGYRYRLRRLGAGRLVSSVAAQLALTLLVMLAVVFALGFVADPVINFLLDPYGLFYWWADDDDGAGYALYDEEDEPRGWAEHFTKGFASLGLLSFFKVLLSSPMQLLYRHSMGGGGGRGTTGRDRLNNTTWLLIIVGALSFTYAVWKAVRNWSRRTLEKAGERVMDVQGDEGDDDDE